MDIHIPAMLGYGFHILDDCRRGSISVLIPNQVIERVDYTPWQLTLATAGMNMLRVNGARYQTMHGDSDGQCLLMQSQGGRASDRLVRGWRCTQECLYRLHLIQRGIRIMHIATGYGNSLSRR